MGTSERPATTHQADLPDLWADSVDFDNYNGRVQNIWGQTQANCQPQGCEEYSWILLPLDLLENLKKLFHLGIFEM